MPKWLYAVALSLLIAFVIVVFVLNLHNMTAGLLKYLGGMLFVLVVMLLSVFRK